MADRPLNEVSDYDEEIVWLEEDGDVLPNSKLFAAMESTEKLLRETFSKGVSNSTQKQWREHYGEAKCPKTRVTKLDKMVKD